MISNNIRQCLANSATESIINVNSPSSGYTSTIVKNLTDKLSLSLIQDDSSQAISAISLINLVGMIILSMDNTTDKEQMLGLAASELTPELEAQIHSKIGEYTLNHPFTENNNARMANFLSSYYQINDHDLKKQLLNLYAIEYHEPTSTKNVADTIDEYINQKTNGKITNMFASLPPKERKLMMFTMGNVIDFKGVWETPFNKDLTRPQEFQCANGKIIQNVNMMHLTENVAFASGYEFNIIIKNFTSEDGKAMQFIAIVPQDQSNATIKDLNSSIIDSLINIAQNSRKQKVSITIPQVKIDTSINGLKEGIEAVLGVSINAHKLAKLGINSADILNITQKINAKFDEEGAEFSAVSVVSAVRSISMPIKFTFNKPGYMAIREGNQKLIETVIKDEKFLITDGAVKYSTFVVPAQKKIRLDNNLTFMPSTQKGFGSTSIIDNLNCYILYETVSYTTKEDIEACCKQQPTINKVMGLIPATAQPYSNLVIKKYIINTKNGNVTQYLIKDNNTEGSFNSSNCLILNKKRMQFTDDNCVTAVYSLNGKLEFKCEDIPKVSPIKEVDCFKDIDITNLINDKFNKNGTFAISNAVIDNYRIKIMIEKSETQGKKLQQNIQQELGSEYKNFISYWKNLNQIEITFSAADKVKQLLGIDNKTSS